MSNASNTAETLNDLIQINNDRIAGYQRAMEKLEPADADLKNLFTGFITQSQDLKSALQNEVTALGEEVEQGTTISGKIYRRWMDVKALFSGDDRQTALNNCEFGEDAAQKAYQMAESDGDIAPNVRSLIINQKLDLKTSHDKVKILRDSENL